MSPEQYERIAAPFRRHPQWIAALKGTNRALTMLCYIMYPSLLVWLYQSGSEALLRCIVVPAVLFAAVSIFRAVFDAPRPYERGLDSLMKKKRTGHSFPSRHVFSAFMIAMSYGTVSPGIGAALCAVGTLLAAIRVVGGVHDLRDVIAGALIAVIGGGIGFWLLPW